MLNLKKRHMKRRVDPFFTVNMKKINRTNLSQNKLHKIQETANLPSTKKMSFIHPTKCGGTAVENFLYSNYSRYFSLEKGHGPTCLNHNNSVIIVRDPIDRFKSIYKYWKYGSAMYERDNDFIQKYGNVSVKQFIHFLKTNATEHLYNKATWDVHFKPITHWIRNTQLNKIIILKYQKDIDPSIQKLLRLLKIPTNGKKVPHVNITKKKEVVVLDDEDIAFVKDYYQTDYALWEKIEQTPTLFRCVI